MSTPSLRDAALAYAKRAWRVFPLPPREKSARLKDWPTLATYDEKQILTWWNEEPEANVALATGFASGVFVLDVDGEAGELSLAKLEALYEKLQPTYQVNTGRGRHLYFIYPDGVRLANSAGLLGPGLDV